MQEIGIVKSAYLASLVLNICATQGADVKPGDFAENITVEGMVLYELAVGTQLTSR